MVDITLHDRLEIGYQVYSVSRVIMAKTLNNRQSRAIQWIRRRPRPTFVVLGLFLVLLSYLPINPFGISLLHQAIDIFQLLIREAGAVLVAVAVVGFAFEKTEWANAIRGFIADALTDRDIVSKVGYEPPELRRRLNGIIAALHGTVSDEVLYAFQEDVVDELAKPIRESLDVVLQLSDVEDTPFAKLSQSVEYELSGPSGFNVFGDECLVYKADADILANITEYGFQKEDMISFDELTINGRRTLEKGVDYHVNREPHEDRDLVEIEVTCPEEFTDSELSKRVQFTVTTLVRDDDIFIYQLSRITKTLRFQFIYNLEEFDTVELRAQIPNRWGIPLTGERQSNGSIERIHVNARNKVFLPTYSIAISWAK